MTKGDFVVSLAEKTGFKKVDAEKALNGFLELVKDTLKGGGEVSFAGFGTFRVTQRQARTGKNPQTGKEIKIAAKTVPQFRPGKGLKDAVAGGAVKTPKKQK